MIDVKIYSEYGSFPVYAKEGDSGVDVFARGFSLYSDPSVILDAIQFTLFPNERILIHTGYYLDISNGYECQVRSRSGLALKQGLVVCNSPGTVDRSYKGECNVILINQSQIPQMIFIGDRIAQFVFCPVVKANFIQVRSREELSISDRGEKGFGSTGIK